ncbi:MAG: hypothetical protein ACFE8N_12465, partial [Promethearchaeota archaeon]
SIGTDTDYLKNYIERNEKVITEKVTAQILGVKQESLEINNDQVFGRLNICANKACSASLKENVISKLKKNDQINCPYCNTQLTEDNIKSIFYAFFKI